MNVLLTYAMIKLSMWGNEESIWQGYKRMSTIVILLLWIIHLVKIIPRHQSIKVWRDKRLKTYFLIILNTLVEKDIFKGLINGFKVFGEYWFGSIVQLVELWVIQLSPQPFETVFQSCFTIHYCLKIYSFQITQNLNMSIFILPTVSKIY